MRAAQEAATIDAAAAAADEATAAEAAAAAAPAATADGATPAAAEAGGATSNGGGAGAAATGSDDAADEAEIALGREKQRRAASAYEKAVAAAAERRAAAAERAKRLGQVLAAVAQARANPSVWVCVAFGSARETKRRGFLSGVKNATREIYRIRAAPRRCCCCGSGSIAVGFWSDDRCLHPRRCARGGRQPPMSTRDYPCLAPRARLP